MTNIVSGKLQTENHGDLQIVNVVNGDCCTLKFHEQSGMFSRENTLKKVVLDFSVYSKSKFLLFSVLNFYGTIFMFKIFNLNLIQVLAKSSF